MSDDIRPTDQIIYGVDIYDASHALLVDLNGYLKVVDENTAKLYGTWFYYAGVSGTVSVAGGQRVTGIGCHSTAGGSYTIDGGATIPIPPGVGINVEPDGNLVAPTIVFTGTDSYLITVVS